MKMKKCSRGTRTVAKGPSPKVRASLIMAMMVAGLAGCGKTEGADPADNTGNVEITAPAPEEVTDPAGTTEDTGSVETAVEMSSEEAALRQELYDMGLVPRNVEWSVITNRVRNRIANESGVEVDLTKPGTITDIKEEGGKVTGFTLHIPDGREIPCEAQGVTINADGTIRISQGGYFCSLKEIEGMYGLGLEGAEACVGVLCGFGASPMDLPSVASSEELLYGGLSWSDLQPEYYLDFEDPFRFGYFKVGASDSCGDIYVASMNIYADGEHHGLGKMILRTEFYGWLREGDYYEPGREVYDEELGVFTFYLVGLSDVEGAEYDYFYSNSITGIEDYTVGDLHAKDGSVKSKDEPLVMGDYLDVTVKGATMKVELPICSPYYPENMHEGSPTNDFVSEGDLNVLVVPIYYGGQEGHLDADLDTILNSLGNVVLADGSSEERPSGDGYFTLSDYFSKASYGKLNITSYVTDWYQVTEENYEDYMDSTLRDEQNMELQTWVNNNYGQWQEKLDANKDDIYDAMIVICASSGFERDYHVIPSVGGAVTIGRAYGHWYGHDGETIMNKYVLLSADELFKDRGNTSSPLSTNVLMHEMGHGFGLIDYYDVYYSGYDAVGDYDMQAGNYGDWNPYSKFAAGWLTPHVITPEEIGDGITVTLSKFTENGDVLVLPTERAVFNADGSLNPFNEYIMLDLFSPDGLNTYDAKECGITATGVRIYHIDARLLQINYKKDWAEDGYTYDVLQTNAYNESGRYHVNLLQRGGNTFTAGDYRRFQNGDLFMSGDSFTTEKYAYSFTDGKMNDGSEFPYIITVKSVSGEEAVIEIKPAK